MHEHAGGRQAGTRLGPYRLLELLGRGAHGEVWRAVPAAEGGEPVALKLPLAEQHLPALLQGARAQAALRHPAIVRVLRIAPHAEPPYVAYRLLAGGSLRARLRAAPLEPAEAAALLAAVLGGLAHAHRAGVAHLDLKPENVLADGRGGWALTDFGLGPAAGSELVLSEALGSGFLAATPAYLAPEVLAGQPPGPAADVYACGLLVFEALTARLPCGRELPSQVRPGLAPWCDRAYELLCAPPGRRPADAAAALAAVRRLQPAPLAEPPGGAAPMPRWTEARAAPLAWRELPARAEPRAGAGAGWPRLRRWWSWWWARRDSNPQRGSPPEGF
ncbi:MAG: hypothetical protein KatS3mg102_1527 [Planctomycetota bacterium]|nr:MAG: hypothetical protein KatS3mg102_1527 [Planctomycetota bacterium]